MNPKERAKRIVTERERLGLSVAQFAVLVGVTEEVQKALESGDRSAASRFYWQQAQKIGADPLYMVGESSEPAIQDVTHMFANDSFLVAVDLLRRSQQAVEAFVGKGAAKESPELVVALMSATLHGSYRIGPGDMEDFTDKIANAIEAAGGAIANALSLEEED